MKEKIIGILGGMGPEATLHLFEKILRCTPASSDQEHLRVIIDNNPKVPDRTRAIIGNGKDPVPFMVETGRSLERAGADFIIIPCVSAHYFIDELRRELDLPILSIFDAVSDSITRDHPDIKAIGLLATDGTIQGGRFQEVLLEHGIGTLVPEPADQERVMSTIYMVKSLGAKKAREEAGNANIREVSAGLVGKGAGGIVAGCTEIPLVLGPEDVTVPLFDPLSILADAAVKMAKT